MPPLDVQQARIESPVDSPRARPVHPDPRLDGLRLEVMSGKELGWWGNRFGIDTPYYATFAGWGEALPLTGFDVAEVDPADVVILDPNALRGP